MDIESGQSAILAIPASRSEAPADVPLSEAMLLWDDNANRWYHAFADAPPATGDPLVVDHSSRFENASDFDNATGACFGYWREKSTADQLIELMRDAWMAVVRDKVEPDAMHAALLVVPEFRALIHPDELPACYREHRHEA